MKFEEKTMTQTELLRLASIGADKEGNDNYKQWQKTDDDFYFDEACKCFDKSRELFAKYLESKMEDIRNEIL